MGEAAIPASRPPWRWLVWLFAALGVAAAIAIISLAVAPNGAFSSREPAIVAAKQGGSETLEVGNVRLLAGTGLIAIEIRAVDDREIKVGSGSYSAARLRNLLLLDRKTGASRRVLPDNATVIADIEYFSAAAGGAESALDDIVDIAEESREPPPAYYLLTLERRLPNGDRVSDLLVGTLATGKQGIVMRGLAGVEQTSMLDATRLGVVVREGKGLYYRVIDVPSLKLVESHKIEVG